ncbi:MAG: hypothetical protein KAX84_14375 [Burkholderiales bacterium]|nr:hypothetical protein [Burkholderiales bacterium]
MNAFATNCARWTAVLSLLMATTVAALPPSSPGSLDPNYGTNGVLALSLRSGYESPTRIVPTPEGKWLVSGDAQNADGQGYVRYLLRLDSQGGIDTGFGAQGLVYPAGNSRALVVQGSGGIVIGDAHYDSSGMLNAEVRRLRADGSRDPDFGTANGATVLQTATPALPSQAFAALDLDAEGRILGATSLSSGDRTMEKGEVWRFSANGVPDPAFGNQGRVALDDLAPYLKLQQLRAQPDGKVVIAAWCQASSSAKPRACVIRLNSNGTRDAAFGSNGVRDIAPPANTSYSLHDLRIAGDGRIYAAGTNFYTYPPRALVMRLNADGTLDPGYGAGGIVTLTFAGYSAYVFAVHPLADGRQTVIGMNNTGDGQSVGYVARLTAAGLPDPSFGAGGFAATASAAAHDFSDGVVLAGGGILAVGTRNNAPGTFTDVDTLLVRYVGVETLGGVIEFHNTMLDHYFITADPNEAAAIDGGSAGPGWVRTGSTFKSGGPARVCRFYGSIDIDPATGQRRGPNSHFYTIEAGECAWVKLDPGWHFESYDFSGWPRSSDGSCPAGTTAVKRVYNNRFAQNDSNHRYASSDAIYNQMVALGWSPEGVVFCSIQ